MRNKPKIAWTGNTYRQILVVHVVDDSRAYWSSPDLDASTVGGAIPVPDERDIFLYGDIVSGFRAYDGESSNTIYHFDMLDDIQHARILRKTSDTDTM
jgi:hypothetical protein